MKILVIDNGQFFLDFCLRSQDAGHEVRLWLAKSRSGEDSPVGKGMVDRISDWKKWMSWADLIVISDNSSYRDEFEPFFEKGFPIFGCNKDAGELELNRERGQQVLKRVGIDVPKSQTFTNYDKAIEFVRSTNKPYVSKPWGGSSDKALSYVSKSAADMVFKLQHWKEESKLNGSFMLQEFVKGTEIAVGGWFGPHGWNRYVCENFEEKSFMNDGLGGNTGEQGTVLRYVKKSKLFNEVLEPLTDHLHSLNYVGYCDVNTIIDPDGRVWPLEFTMRFGDPTSKIQQSLHTIDDATWMAGLVQGKDLLTVSTDVAVGVLMTHGDYPHSKLTGKKVTGFPIYGITEENCEHIHFLDVMDGVAPAMVGGEVEDVAMEVTAGDHVLIVTGTGATVRDARKEAYNVAWKLNWPSNRMMRTDIGRRLQADLPKLQEHGFVTGITY